MVTFCPVSVMRVTDCSEPNKKKDKTPSVKKHGGGFGYVYFQIISKMIFCGRKSKPITPLCAFADRVTECFQCFFRVCCKIERELFLTAIGKLYIKSHAKIGFGQFLRKTLARNQFFDLKLIFRGGVFVKSHRNKSRSTRTRGIGRDEYMCVAAQE